MNVFQFRREFIISWLLVLIFGLPSNAQHPEANTDANHARCNTEQVVDNLIQMNRHRLESLRAYESNRTYKVEYHGFGGSRSAEMAVKLKYSTPPSKEFTIESTSGSKLLIDKVLKKLLEAEKEALDAEAQRRTALNRDNYDFKLVDVESTPAGSMYVLSVEPKTKEKFLYRGRIWVDAKDFAVKRLVAEPAKNPSFWTKKSDIEQVYRKVNDFWLPERNHSLSSIRLGGRAELTIEYKDYQITSAVPVAKLSPKELAPSAANSVSAQHSGDDR
jgi:hypothetical protein